MEMGGLSAHAYPLLPQSMRGGPPFSDSMHPLMPPLMQGCPRKQRQVQPRLPHPQLLLNTGRIPRRPFLPLWFELFRALLAGVRTQGGDLIRASLLSRLVLKERGD